MMKGGIPHPCPVEEEDKTATQLKLPNIHHDHKQVFRCRVCVCVCVYVCVCGVIRSNIQAARNKKEELPLCVERMILWCCLYVCGHLYRRIGTNSCNPGVCSMPRRRRKERKNATKQKLQVTFHIYYLPYLIKLLIIYMVV